MNTNTVYRLEKQMRETGSVKTRTSQRGRKHALTPEDLQNIDRVVQQEPDITIDEIIDKLGLHVCNETVRKAVIIAIPENNAKNSALQNVNYCVTDFLYTTARNQKSDVADEKQYKPDCSRQECQMAGGAFPLTGKFCSE